jgi:hypothetical protein
MTDSARWFALIEAQLHELKSKLERNIDIAPAQRLQLEGFIAAAHADGVELDELLRFCARQMPPNCVTRIDEQHKALQIDCWQQRAPVYPSTQD